MTKMYSEQQQLYTDGSSIPKKVATVLQAPPAAQYPQSRTHEPETPRVADTQQPTVHATVGTSMAPPAAVAHAEARATAIARARLRAGASPRAALAEAAAGSTVRPLDAVPEASAGAGTYQFPTSMPAPSPAAAAARAAERGAAAAGRAAGRLSKYASQTGLHGVAEAAGHVIGGLTPALQWRQEVLLTRLAAGTTLALVLGYVLLFAPRSLGWRAEMRLVFRLGADNAVAFALMNLLGFFPAILGCVAWPLLRSAKLKPQLWRYLMASTLTGAFALLSYLAAWDPPRPGKASTRMPPQHLTGRSLWLQRAYESRLFPAVLLALSSSMIILALNSSAATWAQFGYLVSHSFSFHVMLLDFSLLILLSAWLVSKDAKARGWPPAATTTGRRFLQAGMLMTPVIGPGVYLLLRPISREGGVLPRGWLRRSAAAAWAAVKSPLSLPAGGIAGSSNRAGGAAAAAGGRPAQSTNSRRHQGVANGVAGGAAPVHRRDVVQAVTHAAAVPLPATGAAGAAVGAVRHWAESAWFSTWSWAGQKVARFRGGGAPVAAEDEAAGHELDAMDDGEVQINHTAEGADTTHDNTAAYAAAPATPTAFAGFALQKLGALIFPHVPPPQQQQLLQQEEWQLGPTRPPQKGKDDEDGTDMLLFTDDYDEFDYDYDASSSSDDDDDESAEWGGDSGDDDEDDEGLGPQGFEGQMGVGEGGFGRLVTGLWQQQQQLLQQQGGADDMDIDEELDIDA